MLRTLTPRQHAVDAVLAAVLGLVCLPFAVAVTGGSGLLGAVSVGVLFVMCAVVAIRRLSPALALALCWYGVIVQMLAGLSPNLYNAAVLVVLYASARYSTGRTRWAGLASAVVGAVVASAYMVLVFMAGGLSFDLTNLTILGFGTLAGAIAGVVVLGLSWTLGLLMRVADDARRAGAERYQAEARRREAERETVVEQERNRIARDMHDVVAHSLAVVVAQADGARYAYRGDADRLADTLETVSGTARQALGDVRLLLSELRHEQAAGPVATLDELPRLFESMRAAGLDVRTAETGEPVVLPSGHQVAVYRILQEALTNALHHGDRSVPVTVHLAWGTQELALTVVNGVAERAEDARTLSRGHGLPGMRERAVLAGGTLAIDAPVAGSFRVHAVIPAVTA